MVSLLQSRVSFLSAVCLTHFPRPTSELQSFSLEQRRCAAAAAHFSSSVGVSRCSNCGTIVDSLRSCKSFGLDVRIRVCRNTGDGRGRRRFAVADGTSNGTSGSDGTPAPTDRSVLKSRREMLLEYVKNVQPDFMERFVKRAPQQVVEAMRHTVTNMLGTLPPQFFDISVTTVAENLAQLMYSVMMTGYMFRNAQYRLELQQSLVQVALPDLSKSLKSPSYEPGVNKSKVSGEVMRWHKEDGPEVMATVEYIEILESEIEQLQQQLEKCQGAPRGRNELLEYLKSLKPQNLQELTTSAGEDALEAMNTFVQRLLGVQDSSQLKRTATETTAPELAKLLYWLMVVGYSIRNIEVRYDMERVLGIPISSQKLAELPPGENM